MEIPYSRMIKTEKNTVNSDRFRPVEFSDIDKCLEENENENTNKKTLSDIRLFKSYLVNTGENTEIENMTAENLNEKFSTFLLSVTKKMNLPHSEDSCVVWVVIIVREIKS